MCQTAVAADFTSDGLPDVIVDAHGENATSTWPRGGKRL